MAILTLAWESMQEIVGGREVAIYETSSPLALNTDFRTPLSGLFVGGATPAADDWVARGAIKEIVISGIADQASDSSGVLVEQSIDGATVHDTPWSATAAIDTYLDQVIELTAPYFRFRWQNAGVAQTSFLARVSARR